MPTAKPTSNQASQTPERPTTRQNPTSILAFGLTLIVFHSNAMAEKFHYKPGDKVTTIKWKTEFKVGKEVKSRQELGEDFVVEKLQGNWLYIRSKAGWVSRDDVVAFEQAVSYFTKKLDKERSDTNYYDRGCLWHKRGEYDLAISDFNDAIRLDPDDAALYNGRGSAYTSTKQLERAMVDFDKAIQLDPSNAMVFNNRGFAFADKKQYDRALADYDQAIRLDPTLAMAFNNRGIAYADKKQFDRALADYDQAIELDPTLAMAFNNRGICHHKLGRYEQEIADYERAIQFEPTVPHYNNLAWYLATCPKQDFRDGHRAVTLAKKACELCNWKETSYVGTLAAAYARVGDFTRAQDYLDIAIQMDATYAKDSRAKMKEAFDNEQPYTESVTPASVDASKD
ncbi:MAG: tetratricopeptide repeat protein [Planctomycetota bacterium]